MYRTGISLLLLTACFLGSGCADSTVSTDLAPSTEVTEANESAELAQAAESTVVAETIEQAELTPAAEPIAATENEQADSNPAAPIAEVKLTPEIKLRIEANDQITADDGESFSSNEAQSSVDELVQVRLDDNIQLEQIRVVISFDDKATHGQLDQLIKACLQANVYRFAFDVEKQYDFDLPPELKTPYVPFKDDTVVPPYTIVLQANAQGKLESIKDFQVESKSAEQLQHRVRVVLGEAPNEVTESTWIVFKASPNLLLSEFFPLYQVLAEYEDEKGNVNPLAKTIVPAGFVEIPRWQASAALRHCGVFTSHFMRKDKGYLRFEI